MACAGLGRRESFGVERDGEFEARFAAWGGSGARDAMSSVAVWLLPKFRVRAISVATK